MKNSADQGGCYPQRFYLGLYIVWHDRTWDRTTCTPCCNSLCLSHIFFVFGSKILIWQPRSIYVSGLSFIAVPIVAWRYASRSTKSELHKTLSKPPSAYAWCRVACELPRWAETPYHHALSIGAEAVTPQPRWKMSGGVTIVWHDRSVIYKSFGLWAN